MTAVAGEAGQRNFTSTCGRVLAERAPGGLPGSGQVWWPVRALSTAVAGKCVHGAQHVNSRPEGLRGGQAWWKLAGVALAAGGCTVGSLFMREPLQAEATAVDSPHRTDNSAAASQLAAWLRSQEAQVDGIFFGTSGKAELGVFATGKVLQQGQQGFLGKLWGLLTWQRRRHVLASFPMSAAITQQSVTGGRSAVAVSLRELVDLGMMDENLVVMASLMVERAKGGTSAFAPWLTMLPSTFSTSLYYTEDEMDALRGTTLYTATKAKHQQMHALWLRLEPAMRELFAAEGLPKPQYEDFLWAYSIFWSRAVNMPLLRQGKGGPGKPEAMLEVQVGVVPGLDFCNHAECSTAVWFVAPPPKGTPGEGHVLELVSESRRAPAAGEEITISYGEKSNEELLFHYGFTVPNNPHDMLMIHCPIPPEHEWDEVMRSRMLLLMSRGLSTQFFLLAAGDQQSTISYKGSKQGGKPSSSPLRLSEEVWGTLEVFVMDKRLVVPSLEATGLPDGSQPDEHTRQEIGEPKHSGMRMAILSTLVKLLEYKAEAMEGEDGTGPLEEDFKILQAAEAAGQTTGRLLDAVRYRASQKQLARTYLAMTRAALQEVMQLLSEAE